MVSPGNISRGSEGAAPDGSGQSAGHNSGRGPGQRTRLGTSPGSGQDAGLAPGGHEAGSSGEGPGRRKRVLVITYYWPPSGGAGVQRFLKFVKYFRDFGVDPIVLTCSNPTYPIVDESLVGDVPDGVPVVHARTLEPFGVYSRMSGVPPEQAANPTTVLGSRDLGLTQRLARWLRANLFVPDARAGWVPFALHKARKIVRQYNIDTVVTTGPPHSTHFIGKALKKRTGVQWIADFRDPWTDIHYNRALPRTRLTRWLDTRLEKKILLHADEITVTAPGTARYFSRRVDRKYHTIPNGFDPDDFSDPEDARTPAAGGTGHPFCIRHVGSITETSVPAGLLRVLSRLPESDIRLECIGATHPEVRNQAARLELGARLTIHPYVPHREATALMQQADLNLVVVHRSDDSRILIPGKIYDYLKAGKPVLAIGPPDGDAAAIIRYCRMGVAFDYEDEEGLQQYLVRLMDAKNRGAGPSAITPDRQAIDEFSRTALTRRLAALVHGSPLPEPDFHRMKEAPAG